MLVISATILLVLTCSCRCFKNATANIKSNGNGTSIGNLTFTQQDANSSVIVIGTLTGLTPSALLGFHIHESPVVGETQNCTMAGAHFNPYKVAHGPRNGTLSTRHVGDLGNIQTDESGTVRINISDSIIQLYNTTQSILSLAVVVHAKMDDLGMMQNGTSNTTGNAGARVACGNIQLKTDTSQGLALRPIFIVPFLGLLCSQMYSMFA